jgi:hypothetical protein
VRPLWSVSPPFSSGRSIPLPLGFRGMSEHTVECPKCRTRFVVEHAGQGCPNCGAQLPSAPGFLVKSPTTFGLTTRAMAIATLVIIVPLVVLRISGCLG